MIPGRSTTVRSGTSGEESRTLIVSVEKLLEVLVRPSVKRSNSCKKRHRMEKMHRAVYAAQYLFWCYTIHQLGAAKKREQVRLYYSLCRNLSVTCFLNYISQYIPGKKKKDRKLSNTAPVVFIPETYVEGGRGGGSIASVCT